jgi:hypothetical protein
MLLSPARLGLEPFEGEARDQAKEAQIKKRRLQFCLAPLSQTK